MPFWRASSLRFPVLPVWTGFIEGMPLGRAAARGSFWKMVNIVAFTVIGGCIGFQVQDLMEKKHLGYLRTTVPALEEELRSAKERRELLEEELRLANESRTKT